MIILVLGISTTTEDRHSLARIPNARVVDAHTPL